MAIWHGPNGGIVPAAFCGNGVEILPGVSTRDTVALRFKLKETVPATAGDPKHAKASKAAIPLLRIRVRQSDRIG
jgi:hypothetical protein